MENFKTNIDRQIEFTQGKNFFSSKSANSLVFIDDTLNAIKKSGDISKEYESILIDYSTEKCLQEFCRINQYYSFNNEAKQGLREIYVELFSSIKSKKELIDEISINHYKSLKDWLLKTNPYAEKIYQNQDEIIQPMPCSEYSAEFQIEILQMDVGQLIEPVLDIGCGKQGNLVNYMRKNGIEATGIDRLTDINSNISNEDWLEYKYGNSKWGTILSNLGFSNHFNHHHLRNDGDFVAYAKKYMEILNSLKIGGKFFYAPSLPFIEKYLDSKYFSVAISGIHHNKFESSIITRIK